MLKHKGFDSREGEYSHTLFPTIDDAFSCVEESYLVLRRLRDMKHPLAVRRGMPKRRIGIARGETSRILRAKGRTYFIDGKMTREGTPYILVTESRLRAERGKSYRASIVVFPEDAHAFMEALGKVVAQVIKP